MHTVCTGAGRVRNLGALSCRACLLRTCLEYCWNMPGPSCRVTSFCLHLQLRVPVPGFSTALSLTTCEHGEQGVVMTICSPDKATFTALYVARESTAEM